jgi:hypothetical protein
MSQERLNSFDMCFIKKDVLDTIDLNPGTADRTS